MTGCHILVRVLQSGEKRYIVRYRRGGRSFKLEHAGSFVTKRDAETRRDLIRGWLAAGKDPRTELWALMNAEPERTVAEAGAAFLAGRIDAKDGTRNNIRVALARLGPLGELPVRRVTVPDVQQWIVDQEGIGPATVRRYLATIRQVLDYAGRDPNPARSPLLRLPLTEYEEITPPTAEHVLAILDLVAERWRLPIVTLEQTGMAVGETQQLTWGDVDAAGDRFRLRRATVKGQIKARARWVQVPDWLMRIIEDTCPPEDRTAERRVFIGLNDHSLRKAIARACTAARIPHYHPHDLRHRRISLWHGQGVPARELASRAGHTRASMSLDVYSHTMPLDEVSRDDFLARLVRHP